MDLYEKLRHFADSWFLLAMMTFFVGVCLYTLRPGSRALHAEIASIPFRNDGETVEAEGDVDGQSSPQATTVEERSQSDGTA